MLRITKSNRDHFKAISRSFFRSLLVRKIQSLFLFAENSNKNLKTNRLVYKIGKLSSIQKQLSIKSCSEDVFLSGISLRLKCPYSELLWSVFSRIQSECGKMRTRITPHTATFHTVYFPAEFVKFFRRAFS